jgi:hypothetical protein
MPLIGGKNEKKKSSSSSTKRHMTVVIGNKEHGLYVSSSPSSAARKAVSKLCATDKKKKVQFHIREITQGSKKKTYGPYLGYIEKLKEPIELKGRIIKYKPVAKLSNKKTKTEGAKKKGSILVVKAKDGKVSTKKETDKNMKPLHKKLDKGMKKIKKTYHKGGQLGKLYRPEREGESLEQPKLNNNNNLHLLANVSTEQKMIDNNSPILDDIELTQLLSGIELPSNITQARFIDYIPGIKLNVGNIIECHVDQTKYPNERWFGIVTKPISKGVYVIWFKKNTFNLEKITRRKKSDFLIFKSIKGVLQL